MPQPQGRTNKRLNGSQGTAAVAADFALGVGWGGVTTATVASGSNAQRGSFTITAQNTSPAQATATVVFTFPDGAWSSAPFGLVNVTSTSAIDEGHVVLTTTTTAATMTFSVLPVNTKVYTFRYVFFE